MKKLFEKFTSENNVNVHQVYNGNFTVCGNRMVCEGCILQPQLSTIMCKLNGLTLNELNELKREYPEEFI